MPTPAERFAKLEARLYDGWSRIDAAPAEADTRSWETFWTQLLREYESLCRELYGLPEPTPRTEVAATAPPADWDGKIPIGCGAPPICSRLGPCKWFSHTGACWTEEAK